MLKGKILVVCLLLSITFFTGSAFALSAGTPFTFTHTVNPGAPDTWDHNLSNTDFDLDLDGSEPYLIINSGNLELNLTFTPVWIDLGGGYGFSLSIGTPSLDGYYTGNTFNYWNTTSGQVTTTWSAPITSQFALDAIADKEAKIILYANVGSIDSVNSSTLSGTGSVGPEPISMVLVSVGIAGLPIAGRIRRFIKRDK